MQIMRKAAEKAAAVRAANLTAESQNRDAPDSHSDSNNAQPTTPGTHASAPDTSHPERPVGPSLVPPLPSQPSGSDATTPPRQPWEHMDEVLQVLKTTWPLLILSLETMIDQIQHKFKLTPEEDIYRNICMLLQDAVQVNCLSIFLTINPQLFQNYVVRMNALEDDGLMANQTIQTLTRMGHNMPEHIKVRCQTRPPGFF